MDYVAFNKLSYGLYVVSARAGGETGGCIVNTFGQVTATPVLATVAVNKDNDTTRLIRTAGRFCVTALTQDTPMELIGLFGFRSGRDEDKFAQLTPDARSEDGAGVPFPCRYAAARFSCEVVQSVDLGTHILFVARVTDWALLADEAPLTYAYYQTVKKGLTPPKASSYHPPEDAPAAERWRCTVCGYIHEGPLPDDFICPVCKQPAQRFEKL